MYLCGLNTHYFVSSVGGHLTPNLSISFTSHWNHDWWLVTQFNNLFLNLWPNCPSSLQSICISHFQYTAHCIWDIVLHYNSFFFLYRYMLHIFPDRSHQVSRSYTSHEKSWLITKYNYSLFYRVPFPSTRSVDPTVSTRTAFCIWDIVLHYNAFFSFHTCVSASVIARPIHQFNLYLSRSLHLTALAMGLYIILIILSLHLMALAMGLYISI